MRTFLTRCVMGDMVTEGEGSGKKLSKRRAAELMLDQSRQPPPTASGGNQRQSVGPTNTTLYGDPHSASQSPPQVSEDHQYTGFPSPLDLPSLPESDDEEPPTYNSTPLKYSASGPGYVPSRPQNHPPSPIYAPTFASTSPTYAPTYAPTSPI